jgi:hypothetical protein
VKLLIIFLFWDCGFMVEGAMGGIFVIDGLQKKERFEIRALF